ncbi:hypothetical protein [Helicobacter labetoulli]|uniref:hypothetical protein n=1 Tax=Helicobacter labetoulli TaxID=2315333 RepID=UPI001FCA3C71|nr:hypothetical protein [Helicobacter labetoulli]
MAFFVGVFADRQRFTQNHRKISLAPFDKALQACINKHNTYPKELLQLGKEENLKASFMLQADTCKIHSLTFDKPKSEFASHITNVLHKAKACIKTQCQTQSTQYTIPFFYRLSPNKQSLSCLSTKAL